MTASLKKKKTEDEFEKERKDTKSKRKKKKTAVNTVENRSSAIEDNMMDREKDP